MAIMGKISKIFALFPTLIIAISCLAVLGLKPTSAQTGTSASSPIPSIPEFTGQLTGPPYIVNTTYYLDENTGKIVPQIGFTNQYSYLEIKIKNQPFTPFVGDEHGNVVQILFNVRIKQSNETDSWVEVYNPYNGYPVQASSGAYTTLEVPIEGGWDSPLGSIAGTQSDVQVEALAGYVHRMVVWSPSFGAPYVFNGTESGWSNTQTIAIPGNIPESIPSQQPAANTPNSWETWQWGLVAGLVIMNVLMFGVLLFCLKKQKEREQSSNAAYSKYLQLEP